MQKELDPEESEALKELSAGIEKEGINDPRKNLLDVVFQNVRTVAQQIGRVGSYIDNKSWKVPEANWVKQAGKAFASAFSESIQAAKIQFAKDKAKKEKREFSESDENAAIEDARRQVIRLVRRISRELGVFAFEQPGIKLPKTPENIPYPDDVAKKVVDGLEYTLGDGVKFQQLGGLILEKCLKQSPDATAEIVRSSLGDEGAMKFAQSIMGNKEHNWTSRSSAGQQTGLSA